MLNSQVVNQAVTKFIEERTSLKEVIVTNITPIQAIFQAETVRDGVKIFRMVEHVSEYIISIEGGHKWENYMHINKEARYNG